MLLQLSHITMRMALWPTILFVSLCVVQRHLVLVRTFGVIFDNNDNTLFLCKPPEQTSGCQHGDFLWPL